MTKPTKWHVRPAKTQISLGIRRVRSEYSLSAWQKLGSLATHWRHSEESDQTVWMSRLIWNFAGCTVILLVLPWDGSNILFLALRCIMSRFAVTWKINLFWLAFFSTTLNFNPGCKDILFAMTSHFHFDCQHFACFVSSWKVISYPF